MFIEKLNLEDYKKFGKDNKWKLVRISKKDKDSYNAIFFIENNAPQLDLYVSDFHCKTNVHFKRHPDNLELEMKWQDFMYSKFGDEYDKELKIYRKNLAKKLTEEELQNKFDELVMNR